MFELRWGALALAAGALAIAGAPGALGQPWLNMVFKPLATLAIIGHAWGRGQATPVVRRWVLAGLGLSLVGDVALLWPQSGFLPGLVAFLLAHLAYLMAFTRSAPLFARAEPLAAFATVAGCILVLLWPGVPAGLRWPVLAYMGCLVAIASQAGVVWLRAEPGGARRRGAGLALGGALFVASDALLAIDRFGTPLPLAALWILATYWTAQWRIASWLRPER